MLLLVSSRSVGRKAFGWLLYRAQCVLASLAGELPYVQVSCATLAIRVHSVICYRAITRCHASDDNEYALDIVGGTIWACILLCI